MDAAATGLEALRAAQGALNVLTALQLVSYRFPQPDTLKDGATFDYVIVGGGTAGSIVASRLSENPDVTVAIIEAGGEPPLETVIPGTFPITPDTPYDFNFPTEQDGFSCQRLRGKHVKMTAGKLLGGTSSVQHLIHVKGNRRDYDRWADAAGDNSWNYDHLVPFFKKVEKLEDPEILASPFANFYDTKGNIGIRRQPSDANNDIIKSFQEIGYKYELDLNSNISLGFTEPLYQISGGVRQSTAECYLGPAKNRDNLFVFEMTTVARVLFDENKNAIGVEAITANNNTVTVNAGKEVILAAGTMKTPHLLLLSGIGPKSELEKFEIPVISDLPVGQTLKDHVGAIISFAVEHSNAPVPPANPHLFPVPTTTGFKALNPSEMYPDCQNINLLFPHDNAGLLQLCSNVFKYDNDVCNKMHEGNAGRSFLYSVVYILNPASSGNVTLRSKDPMANPRIEMGYFRNQTDLDTLASCLADVATLVNTTYFKSVGSEIVDMDLDDCKDHDKNSWEYWRCYGRVMSTTLLHPAATAPMGKVLDSKLKVRGVKNLRVVDAAGMPGVNSGKLMVAVTVFAEKAADLIKNNS